MKLEPFHLERWLLKPHEYDIASAGITKLRLRDLTTTIDFDMVMNYGTTNGSELIRGEIAALYEGSHQDDVLLATGTAEANFLALYRLLERGDELVSLTPTYMQCIELARSLGVDVRITDYKEGEDWAPNIEGLKSLVTDKTKVVLLVNPNNPTGSLISSDEMQSICKIAEEVGAWVVCDGALRGLEVDGQRAATPVEFYDKGIATGSISKIGLTGPRIGWLVSNDRELVSDCWVYKDYTTLCHSGIGEYLATIALQQENLARYIERANGVIKKQLAILSDWVAEHHPVIEWVPSKAGHTAFLKYDLEIDSIALCEKLREEEDVLVGPGDFFGGPPKHLRVRYSGEEESLVQSLTRFGAFLKRHPNL